MHTVFGWAGPHSRVGPHGAAQPGVGRMAAFGRAGPRSRVLAARGPHGRVWPRARRVAAFGRTPAFGRARAARPQLAARGRAAAFDRAGPHGRIGPPAGSPPLPKMSVVAQFSLVSGLGRPQALVSIQIESSNI